MPHGLTALQIVQREGGNGDHGTDQPEPKSSIAHILPPPFRVGCDTYAVGVWFAKLLKRAHVTSWRELCYRARSCFRETKMSEQDFWADERGWEFFLIGLVGIAAAVCGVVYAVTLIV